MPENILALTGWFPVTGFACLILPGDGEPVLLVPEHELEAAAITGLETRGFPLWDTRSDLSPAAAMLAEVPAGARSAIAVEASFPAIAPPVLAAEPALPPFAALSRLADDSGATLLDATPAIEQLRVFKTEAEVGVMRTAATLAATGMIALLEVCQDEGSEAEAVAAFQAAVARTGIGADRGNGQTAWGFAWPQVRSGPDTFLCRKYPPTTDRRIREGDTVLCEVGVCADGMWSDVTRTYSVGEPPGSVAGMFEAVWNAVDRGIEAVVAGRPATEPWAAADRELGELAGPYGMGHGVGWRYHERLPTVGPRSPDLLLPGMCLAFEPGAYVEGVGGVRREENLYVSGTGTELLTAPVPAAPTVEAALAVARKARPTEGPA